jgi:beta-lactamase regulating signal transducer with metallopeptidase domain
MTHLLQLGLSNAAGAAVLAAFVAIPALVLRRRSPAAVHALWLVVLLKLVTPPLWTLPVSWPAAHPDPAPRAEAAVIEDAGPPFAEWAEDAAPAAAIVPEVPADPPTDWWHVAATSAGALWAAGSVLCLVLIATRTLRFRRLLRHAEPVPPDVRLRAEAIAARFGVAVCPDVLFVPGAVCPMLWAAFGPPRLLLPRGLWTRLSDEQRDTLIAHELAHLRRRDHWVRLIEVAATVLYWWHPVLWWARRQLRDAEEQCCDAWVVWSVPTPGGVRHYMSAILEAVEFVSEPYVYGPNRGASRAPAAVPALASGMGEFRRLERRLWMIRTNEVPRRLGRPGLVGILLAAGAALPLAPTLAQVEAPKEETRREVVVTRSADAPSIEGASITFSNEGALVVGADVAPQSGSADNAATVITDARTGNKIEVKGGEMHIVGADEVEQARFEVEKLSAELAQAKQRLKELEKRDKKGDAGAKIEGKSLRLDLKPSVKTETRSENSKGLEKKGSDDQQRRLDRLEQKMDKIDELLSELRDSRRKGKGSPEAPGDLGGRQ